MKNKLLDIWHSTAFLVSVGVAALFVLVGTIAAVSTASQSFDRPQEVSQVYSVIGLEHYYLSLASGAPTLADIQIVGADGRYVQFNPGTADQGSVTLTSTPQSFRALWEASTGKVWADVMFQHGPVGIVSATVGNSGTAAYTIGDKSTTDHKTFAVGETFRLGPGYDFDLNLVALLEKMTGTGAADVGKAEDAAHVSGDSGVLALAVRNDALAALAGTDGDYAVLQVDASGALYIKLPANSGVDIGDVDVTSIVFPDSLGGALKITNVDSYQTVAINLAASTIDQVLVADPGDNKQIWVYGVFMMADTAAGTVTFQDALDAALSGVMAVSDEGGWVLAPSGNFEMPWLICTTSEALEVDTGAATIDGILIYAIVDIS